MVKIGEVRVVTSTHGYRENLQAICQQTSQLTHVLLFLPVSGPAI